MTWQLSNTAPQDGTEFDAWGCLLPDDGKGKRPGQENERLVNVRWGKRDSDYVRPRIGWCYTGSDGWLWACEITHWMPIPKPPI